MIDPEREYTKICKELEGTCIKFGPSSKSYINVLDIREESIEEEQGYLATKIGKLRGFFSLVFGEMDEEKIAILEEKLIKTYEEKYISTLTLVPEASTSGTVRILCSILLKNRILHLKYN